MEFTNKTYIITGAASGIGRCIATELYRLGANVIILDKNKDKKEELKRKFTESSRFLYVIVNLENKEEMDVAVTEIQKFQKTIHGVIHNAADSKGGIFSASYEDFLMVQKVNVVAPFYLSKVLLPILDKKAGIIHIASTRAFMSQSDTESYTASKGALISLTHAMSVSLAGRVRVNSISPGWIDTTYCQKANNQTHLTKEDHTQHPSKRVGTPFDISKAVLFLLDEDNDFLNGENIVIDGGMSKQMIYHNDFGWKFEG